jgi:hypothetical protein
MMSKWEYYISSYRIKKILSRRLSLCALYLRSLVVLGSYGFVSLMVRAFDKYRHDAAYPMGNDHHKIARSERR